MNNQIGFKDLKKSAKKQMIIDTAASLFHKKGYGSTTLDDVSKELGLSKAALYHYVNSKDNLLSIIYTQTFENIFRDTYDISGLNLPPDEKLRRVIRYHIKNIIIKDLNMFSVFFSAQHHLPEKDFQKIREEKKRYTDIIQRIIEEGISKGLFKEADPKLQAYAILGMCNWVYKWFKPDKTLFSPEEIGDYFTSLLETGYLKKEREEHRTDLVLSEGTSKKRKSRTKKQIYEEIKSQFRKLKELFEELEK